MMQMYNPMMAQGMGGQYSNQGMAPQHAGYDTNLPPPPGPPPSQRY